MFLEIENTINYKANGRFHMGYISIQIEPTVKYATARVGNTQKVPTWRTEAQLVR